MVSEPGLARCTALPRKGRGLVVFGAELFLALKSAALGKQTAVGATSDAKVLIQVLCEYAARLFILTPRPCEPPSEPGEQFSRGKSRRRDGVCEPAHRADGSSGSAEVLPFMAWDEKTQQAQARGGFAGQVTDASVKERASRASGRSANA